MSGPWRRISDDLIATFRLEGQLGQDEIQQLGQQLREASDSGYRHMVLDLSASETQSLQQWSPLRTVVEELTHRGARLSVKGATPEVLEGLHNVTVEAQMRWLERQCPDYFDKPPA